MCNVDLLSIQKKNSIVKHQQRCQLMQFSSTNQVADHKRNNLISFRRVLPRSSPFACNGLMPFLFKVSISASCWRSLLLLFFCVFFSYYSPVATCNRIHFTERTIHSENTNRKDTTERTKSDETEILK